MEIEQTLMDKDISKIKLKQYASYRGIATKATGAGIDMKSLIQAETQAGLEIATRKIESQTYDL